MLAVDSPIDTHHLFILIGRNLSFYFLIVIAFVSQAERVATLRPVLLASLKSTGLFSVSRVVFLGVTYVRICHDIIKGDLLHFILVLDHVLDGWAAEIN